MSDATPTPHPDDELAAYLDGRLDHAARLRFQRRLANDESLRREVELQSRIDRGLRSAFVVPAMPPWSFLESEATPAAPREEAIQSPGSQRTARRAASSSRTGGWELPPGLAPLVGLVLVTLTSLALIVAPIWKDRATSDSTTAPPTLDQVYAGLVREGWRVDISAGQMATIQRAQGNRHNEALDWSSLPVNHQIVGMSYVPALTPATTALLGRVEGQPVVIFVDAADVDAERVRPREGANIHVFRRVLGKVVLYEVTPLPQAEFLSYLTTTSIPECTCARLAGWRTPTTAVLVSSIIKQLTESNFPQGY